MSGTGRESAFFAGLAAGAVVVGAAWMISSRRSGQDASPDEVRRACGSHAGGCSARSVQKQQTDAGTHASTTASLRTYTSFHSPSVQLHVYNTHITSNCMRFESVDAVWLMREARKATKAETSKQTRHTQHHRTPSPALTEGYAAR